MLIQPLKGIPKMGIKTLIEWGYDTVKVFFYTTKVSNPRGRIEGPTIFILGGHLVTTWRFGNERFKGAPKSEIVFFFVGKKEIWRCNWKVGWRWRWMLMDSWMDFKFWWHGKKHGWNLKQSNLTTHRIFPVHLSLHRSHMTDHLMIFTYSKCSTCNVAFLGVSVREITNLTNNYISQNKTLTATLNTPCKISKGWLDWEVIRKRSFWDW